MAFKKKVLHDEPVMSDVTILVSVEDLINIAMGPSEANTVNFKMLQAILHILARQLRVLETKVDIRIADIPEYKKQKKKKGSHSSDSPSSDASPKRDHMEDIVEDIEKKSAKGGKKKGDKVPKEAEKRMEEQEKQKKRKDQVAEDESDKESPEKKAKRIKEKEQQFLDEMSPTEKLAYNKQKEKEDALMKDMSPKEKEIYFKEKEKELNDMKKMSPAEKEKHLKNKEKELNALQKMSQVDREKHFKEKEKEDKKAQKDTDKYREEETEGKQSQKGKDKYQEKETEGKQSQKGKDKYQEKETEGKKSQKDRENYQEKEMAAKASRMEQEEKVLEKMSPKEKEIFIRQKEREERDLEKMSPQEKEKHHQEKEKEAKALTKMSPKEREQYLQEKEKEAITIEKMSPKEKEKYVREKKKQAPTTTSSGTSINITEVERQKEKVLIVEKGPTTRRASGTRTGTIEVVTVSQFNLLTEEVEKLKKMTGPVPMPALPDNKKLKADLVKGSASLTDTMGAMQVAARVQAAEAGLARMAGFLTQLAASGALPAHLAEQLEEAKAEMEQSRADLKGHARAVPKSKSVAISPFTKSDGPDGHSGAGAGAWTDTSSSTVAAKQGSMSVSAVMAASRMSRPSMGRQLGVTRHEMEDTIRMLKDEMMRSMQTMTQRAGTSVETAASTARGVAEKMDTAMKLNSRIVELYALTSDYADQLSGFDSGLTTQMQSFQEQMVQMRGDLNSGLVQLETANNNAETAAVMELTQRYVGLQNDLEGSVVEHQHLSNFQKQLGEELRGLVDAVETLKEQKADRDEVFDGLRDKADLSRLSGLLTEKAFALAHAELESRLEICYDKFHRQELVWITAMKDLTEVAMEKAQVMQLLSVKDDAQDQLRDMQEQLKHLSILLGEPKAAVLTRYLSRDGTCAACKVPALMEATDQRSGVPPQLPALRPPPDGQPCVPEFIPIVNADDSVKTHICNRWVGGSHTLVSRAVPREVAPAQIAPAHPVKRYTGYGTDGKLYNLEEELQPCIECNKLSTDEGKEEKEEKEKETGAGDSARPAEGVEPPNLTEHEEGCQCCKCWTPKPTVFWAPS